jgi:hypothetical protein
MLGRCTTKTSDCALSSSCDGADTLSEVSRLTLVQRSTLRSWRDHGIAAMRPMSCPRCTSGPLSTSYAVLLGFHLGDGCLSQLSRTVSLRVSCDRTYPGIIRDVTDAIQSARPAGTVHHVRAPGVVVVQMSWKHWPCLFPQHGPGRKHLRTLVLEDWQREIVNAEPAAFLRGLFHSDGCRVNNWAQRMVAGELKRYDYPRWQFVNHSPEIRQWCCEALDAVAVPWRLSSWTTVSVSTRAGVARLDELIGLKE